MTESAYKQAGVDIEAAADLVTAIKPAIKATNRSGVMSGLGGFGALFDLKDTGYKDPILVSGTDGVGTKLKVAIDTAQHDTIGIDAVAMCVNDIVVQGAEPLFFLDYFATGKLENDVAQRVITGIAQGCKQAGCALIGGETAEMPGMYGQGDYDIAGFSVGAVERERLITGEAVQDGDVILALASSGLHSNGFSLVRHIIDGAQGYDYDTPLDFADGKSFADVVIEPTRIYVRSILEALKIQPTHGTAPIIHSMSHITGGGLDENIPRTLPDHLTAEIDADKWDLPEIFKLMKKLGNLSNMDLRTTLNCGLGMIVICDENDADALADCFAQNGERVYKIGQVITRQNANEPLIVKNMDSAWA